MIVRCIHIMGDKYIKNGRPLYDSTLTAVVNLLGYNAVESVKNQLAIPMNISPPSRS
jgi:hypothetical protein